MELRSRESIKRPRELQIYGYGDRTVPDYARSTFTVNKRAKKRVAEAPSQEPLCTESFEDCLVSLFEDEQQKLKVQPYQKPGREKRLSVQSLHVQIGNDEAQLYVRGDSVKLSCNDSMHVGQIEDIVLQVSMGTQLLLRLRPYYICSDLDAYIDNELKGELCIKTPDDAVEINVNNAVAIEKLCVVNSVNEHNSSTTLIRRAYARDNHSWCSLEDCFQRELLHQRQQTEATDNSDDDSDDEESPATDMCLLKHSFESDYGMRGFVDFLYVHDISGTDRMNFGMYIENNYIQPCERVGDSTGTARLMQLSTSADSYSVFRRLAALTEQCYLCGQTTQCAYGIEFHDTIQHVPLSRGCAKRLQHLKALKSFLKENEAAHESLTREQLCEKYEILRTLLYKIDRVLARPIRWACPQ